MNERSLSMRAGLSRNEPVKSLLQQVNGKPRGNTIFKDNHQTKKHQSSRNTPTRVSSLEGEDVSRPPDSDSSDENSVRLGRACENSSSESSDSDKHSIRRTEFQKVESSRTKQQQAEPAHASKRKKRNQATYAHKRIKSGKERRCFKKLKDLGDLDPSPKKARTSFRKHSPFDDELDSCPKLKLPVGSPKTPGKQQPGPRRDLPRGKEGAIAERKKSPEPKFKAFQSGALDDGDMYCPPNVPQSPLSAILSDEELDQERDNLEQAAVCPQCLAPVNKDLFTRFLKKGRMDELCRIHTTITAKRTFASKGYPKINWGSLEARLREYDDLVKRLLSGEEKSHYAALLQEKLKSGEGRLIRKTNMTPGYYGPRGLRIMSEYLVGRFSADLRRKAVENHLVSARGNMSYIQTVIIPEITVQMIMKDMAIGQEEARKVFIESKEVGELLNEDQGDIVLSDEEVDDSEG